MKHTVQKLLLTVSVLLMATALHAQTTVYGNEWIDYSKTYYKFKVGADGAVRIQRSTLDAAGLPSTVTGANFIMYRDGQEVPIYVSANTMAATDYIEFWGKKADGSFDKQLYVKPSAQPDDRISLFTDTACYYLTWDANSNHARYVDGTTAIPTTPPAPQAYCIATVGNYYKNAFCGGATYSASDLFYSAEFDQAEGFVEGLYNIRDIPAIALTIATPNVVTNAPIGAQLNTSVVTQSGSYTHEVAIRLNNQLLADSTFGISETKSFSLQVPASQLGVSNTITYSNLILSSVDINRFGVSYNEIVYPRNFDVTGLSTFSFKLPASNAQQYVEFINFSGAQPRLYDALSNIWFNGDVSVPGKVRFMIPASISTKEFLLTSNSAVPTLSLSKKINFTDFGASAQQGNYVILSHSALMQPVNGHDYIKDYKDYRASTAGGNYNVVVADVADLYDAFAYGYDIHPMAIRRYLQYAYDKWSQKPAYLNIIGRGILYSQYSTYRNNSINYNFPIVPTFGDPGSDIAFVNFGNDRVQKMAVGRISVWNAIEVANYLNKVKEYELALPPAALPSVSTEWWKKQALHIAAAASDPPTQKMLATALESSGMIVQDTMSGYKVFANARNTPGTIDPVNSKVVDSLINSGITLLTYYGHAAPSGFEYALNNPEQYHNSPRLPFLLAMGCDVAQMFALNTKRTIAERYVLHATGGAIAVLAADNLGYPDFLTPYLDESYKNIAYKSYGATIGVQIQNTYNAMLTTNGGGLSINPDKLSQLETQIYGGDPAVRLYSNTKPDYHIPSDGMSTIPGNVTISLDSFKLRITAYNLAKATHDTVAVKVEHRAPDGTLSTIKTYKIYGLLSTDTQYVWVPINPVKDLGINKYIVTIDEPNRWDEVSEANNVGVFDLFIYSDNLIPVYPKEFAIVNRQGITLKASTLNPFRPVGRYKMQLDTTMLFNSPQFQETNITSAGGVIKWTPNLLMRDSTVYYWRTAFDSSVGGTVQWTASSFVYLAQGTPGWNQSHFYQFRRDGFDNLDINDDRTFNYRQVNNKLFIVNTIRYSNDDAVHIRTYWNDVLVQRGPHWYTALQVSVIDSVSGKWWMNSATDTKGAFPPDDPQKGMWSREFPTDDATGRIAAAHYIDSIPKGNYVILRNTIAHYPGIWFANSPPIYINEWKADATLPGSGGRSLYNAIKDIGFDDIDSFTADRVFIFVRKVGSNAFPVTQLMTPAGTSTDSIVFNTTVPSLETNGSMNGTIIGPATRWESLKWKYHPNDNAGNNDVSAVSVYGIDTNNAETFLYRVTADTVLDSISAKKYPNIRMAWSSTDTVNHTAPQLDYWRVLYSPVPEAALNPAAHFAFADSLHVGQQASFSVAVENLTDIPMDSMLVRYKIIDAGGASRLIANKRYKRLMGDGDTLHAWVSFDPAPYPGKNSFFVEANPDNDQPEQYHPNNLGYIPMKVIADKSNPLLDVTFDGQHILDGDIVSAKPFIKVLLKDENQFLAMDDTSAFTVSLRYPNDPISSSRTIPFDGTICKFIPAHLGSDGKNEAVIEFRPEQLEDGVYELFVAGKDKSGNVSGLPQGASGLGRYQISFEVENKSTISNVLNYPNPFSTSTAFVFTLTGSEIPSQFKIQIMTVTGRVVREITKNELGPIHIGRNITEYKWDGRDQYGQVLGNGVYMYRVATSLAGADVEHRESGADSYFKGGWGKMYIMR